MAHARLLAMSVTRYRTITPGWDDPQWSPVCWFTGHRWHPSARRCRGIYIFCTVCDTERLLVAVEESSEVVPCAGPAAEVVPATG